MFLDAGALSYSDPLDKQLFLARLIEKVPNLSFDVLDVPTNFVEAEAQKPRQASLINNPTFAIGLISFAAAKEISRMKGLYVPVAELGVGRSGPACTYRISTYDSGKAKASKSRSTRMISTPSSDGVLQTWAALEKISPVKIVPEKEEAMAMLGRKADLVAVALVGSGSAESPFSKEVESRALKLAKTYKTDIPCALLVRKSALPGIEESVISASLELDRRFLRLDSSRQKRILELLAK